MKPSPVVACVIGAHVFASTTGAQASTALTTPESEFAEPFSAIASIRELRDGRVIVVDDGEYVVKLVDFTRTEASQVGRKGAHPAKSNRNPVPLLVCSRS